MFQSIVVDGGGIPVFVNKRFVNELGAYKCIIG